jgi:hypothetical protein
MPIKSSVGSLYSGRNLNRSTMGFQWDTKHGTFIPIYIFPMQIHVFLTPRQFANKEHDLLLLINC